MNTVVYRCRFLPAFVVFLICSIGIAFAGVDEEFDFRLEKSLELKRNSGGGIEFLFDLDELPAGKSGLVVLNLVNTTDEEFVFGTIETGCGCLKVRAFGDRIPAHGKLEVETSLKTRMSVNDLLQRHSFFLKQSPGVGVTVHLKYFLSGALTFPEKLHLTTAVLGAQSHSFMVPILFSNPVRKENLQVDGIDGLQLVHSKCVEKDGTNYLACTVNLEDLSGGSCTGTLRAKDKDSGRQAEVRVIIDSPSLVSVAPSVVRPRSVFAPSEIGKTEFAATLLIRVHPEALDDLTGDATVKLTSSLKGFRFESTRLVKGVYRVKVYFTELDGSIQDQPLLSTPTKQVIKWSVFTKKLSREGDIEVGM